VDSSWIDSVSDWLSSEIGRVTMIIVGALVLYLIVRLFSRRFFRASMRAAGDRITAARERRLKTIEGVIRGLLVGIIIITATLMVLNELDYSIGPLLAGAGIAGVALGFGAQTLIKDLIGGYFVIMEGQFLVGDWI
jgi:small conductance mechanosensitive channel